MTLTIAIPGLPPVALRGNNWTATNGQRWARRRSAVDWGTTAHYAIVDARNRSGCPQAWTGLNSVTIRVTFVLPDNRRIDTDNLEGQAMKPVWDAMVRELTADDVRALHGVTHGRTRPASPQGVLL